MIIIKTTNLLVIQAILIDFRPDEIPGEVPFVIASRGVKNGFREAFLALNDFAK